MRKAGIDPHGLKPFEDVDKYIAFLERADRARWQKPDELVQSLALKGTETVADIGSGSGYFTFRFAKALPRGRVIALDVAPEMVRHVHHKAMTMGIDNVQATVEPADDPAVPAGVDLVFICDVLHHVSDRPSWLRKLNAQLGPSSRLVIVEFKEGDLPEGPPAAMKIPLKKLIAETTAAGFTLVRQDTQLLPYQVLVEFRKAGGG